MPPSFSDYPAILARMQSRWREIRAEAERVDDEAASSKRKQWQAALEEMKEEYDRLVIEGKWISGPGDLLGVLGRSRRELDHSRILAWLLDPAGAHGFRDSFLTAVLSRCYPSESYPDGELLSMTTRLEAVRPNSRADIVASNQRLTLVFEVKVDAYEQVDQCLRLFQDWDREPDPHFIFLTPSGRTPGTAADDFRPLSFSQVKEILRQCLAEDREITAMSAGQRTAMAYLDTLDAEFR
jgi:hypothetical protein